MWNEMGATPGTRPAISPKPRKGRHPGPGVDARPGRVADAGLLVRGLGCGARGCDETASASPGRGPHPGLHECRPWRGLACPPAHAAPRAGDAFDTLSSIP